ncbi:arsenate reductase family protein [Nocardia sp. NPDC049707]|uniref:arsenate reductase family protein n=1 Tax=Nocardia sp. NPDC049707 TaxID=3154735 RepID=UPI0034153308
MTSGQTEIWHNPRCSKSRNATAHLDETGVAYTVRRYLDDPPTAAELRTVLQRLGTEPWDITRTGEQIAKDLGISGWGRTAADRERWIDALAANPQLIQRPIVLTPDGGAVVARDEKTLESLDPS